MARARRFYEGVLGLRLSDDCFSEMPRWTSSRLSMNGGGGAT
ncbi:MAG: hypothetical protein HY581_11255 [Nitrospirae bacterium]|nr:hypothetical protein [Nitrospirota bacterium]